MKLQWHVLEVWKESWLGKLRFTRSFALLAIVSYRGWMLRLRRLSLVTKIHALGWIMPPKFLNPPWALDRGRNTSLWRPSTLKPWKRCVFFCWVLHPQKLHAWRTWRTCFLSEAGTVQRSTCGCDRNAPVWRRIHLHLCPWLEYPSAPYHLLFSAFHKPTQNQTEVNISCANHVPCGIVIMHSWCW